MGFHYSILRVGNLQCFSIKNLTGVRFHLSLNVLANPSQVLVSKLFSTLENHKESVESQLVEANNIFLNALNSEQENSDEDPSANSSTDSDIGPSDDEMRGLTPKLTKFQKLDLKTSFVSTMSSKMSLPSMNNLFPDANVKKDMYKKSKELDVKEFGIFRSENVTFAENFQLN